MPSVRIRASWFTWLCLLPFVIGESSISEAEYAFGQAPTPPGVSAKPNSSLKEWRQSAKDRRRRVIFNNDGNEPVRDIAALTPAAILELRTTALLGSHVDSIFYCTSGPFGTFHHFTKIGQVFTCKEPPYQNNRMEELLEAGVDPLRVTADFAKQEGIEIFWSLRMNDVHDHGGSGYGPVRFRFNRLKSEHPEYLLSTPAKRSRYGAWSGVNYGREEIRDLAFRFVEEVCLNYDIDGVELDFFRHPVFFQATLQNRPVGDEERALMTELLRRIRRMADERGQSRGRPILMAVRVPDSVEYCRAIGLDIEKWLAEDLVDLLVVSSYFQLNDWEYSVALGHKYGVKVYPSLDESRVGNESARKMRMTPFAYRGRAEDVWAAGADGVYIFNLFDPRDPIWREAGDPAGLARLDRDFFASSRGAVGANGGNLPYNGFQKLETLNPSNPKSLPPGKTVTARIKAGAGYPAGDSAKWVLRVLLDAPPAPDAVQATVNGRPLKLTPGQDKWLECRLQPVEVRTGLNDVTLTVSADAPRAIKWLDLMIQVRR